MLKEMDQRVASGDSDDLILQSFVQEYGEAVLAEPPTHGFNSLAWAIPVIAFVMGLGLGDSGHSPLAASGLCPWPASGPAIFARIARARRAGRPTGKRTTDMLAS